MPPRVPRAIAAILVALVLALAPHLLPGAGQGHAVASPVATTAHSRAELLSDRDAVGPGERFTLALRLRLSPGWHTYWLNPGDSGMAPEFRWTLPEGM